MSKTAACFICGKDFPRESLAQHEKDCLASIQENDTLYTRGTEQDSSLSTRSGLSANSTSSTGSDKANDRKSDRCYICGADVATYLKTTHERSCKRNWELGVVGNSTGSLRRQSSRGGLTRVGSGADLRDISGGALRKSKSSGNIGPNLQDVVRTFNADDKRPLSASRKPSADTSRSHRNLERTSSAALPAEKTDSSSSNYHRGLARVNSVSTSRPSTGPIPKTALKPSKSQSVSNLSIMNGPSASRLTQLAIDISKSSHDVSSPKLTPSTPHYISCPCCGKLYSVHSIAIHQPQCERTRHLQKTIGNDPDAKRKSKSVSDVRALASRLKSSISRNLGGEKQQMKPGISPVPSILSTPTQGRDRTDSLSKKATSDTGSVFTSKSLSGVDFHASVDGPLYDGGVRKTPLSTSGPSSPSLVLGSDDSVFLDSESRKIYVGSPSVDSSSSAGFLKCYLCHQMYGSRSLPIHEKQCLKKMERLNKEEKEKDKSKRKEIREIQLSHFGRSKLKSDDQTSTQSQSSPATRAAPASSRPFSPLSAQAPASPKPSQSQESGQGAYKLAVEGPAQETSDDGFAAYAAEQSSSPRFVSCAYCGRRYGPHSVNIHERTCRLKHSENATQGPDKLNPVQEEDSVVLPSTTKGVKKKVDETSMPLSPALDKNKVAAPKSVSESEALQFTRTASTPGEPVQLIACSDCKRRFLPHDIDRHKLHCPLKS